MNVVSLRPITQTTEECLACGCKNNLHERIWVSYAWPFNKVARRKIDCPFTVKVSDDNEN